MSERPVSGNYSYPLPLKSELPKDTEIDYELFYAEFEEGEVLGKGGIGTVSKWTRKTTDSGQLSLPEKIAVKTSRVRFTNKRHLKSEIETLSILGNHPNILRFYGWSAIKACGMEQKIGIITELCSGTLYDLTLLCEKEQKNRRKLRHYEVARIIKQLLEAILYLHDKSMIHKDIKPNNILLIHEDGHGPVDWRHVNTSKLIVKLGDFGLCKTYGDNDSMSSSGTFRFIPPEVRKASGKSQKISADKTVDIWANGLVVLMLLNAEQPPELHTEEEITEVTENFRSLYSFSAFAMKNTRSTNQCVRSTWDLLCELKDLVRQMLHARFLVSWTNIKSSLNRRATCNFGSDNRYFLDFMSAQLRIGHSKRSPAETLHGHEYLNKIQPLEKDFNNAITTNDTAYLEQLLQRFNLNNGEFNSLCVAVEQGQYDCTKLMVEKFGADIDSSMALLAAAEEGHLQIVKFFCSRGANIDIQDESGRTPLILASKKNCINVVSFLASDHIQADLSVKDRFALTAMDYACQEGHLSVVKQLVHNNSTPVQRDTHTDTAIRYEVKLNPDFIDITHLHHACAKGHTDLVEFLVFEAKADLTKTANCWPYCTDYDTKWNPLHFASAFGNLECIELLLTTGSMCVNARTERGSTPFLLACSRVKKESTVGCTNNNLEILKYLVEEARADVQATDNEGQTALHIAVERNGNITLIKYLIETCHVDVSATDTKGRNVLHYALVSVRSNLDVVRYLVETCHVDTSAMDHHAQNALHYAAFSLGSNMAVIKYLVETCNIDPSATDKEGRNALHYAAMSLAGDTEDWEILQQTKFVDICSMPEKCSKRYSDAFFNLRGNINIVKYLVGTCNVDASAIDRKGRNALHLAAATHNDDIVKYLINTCHVDTSATDSKGRNVLHHAITSKGNNIDIVKYLVKNCDVDTSATDNEGRNVLHYAVISIGCMFNLEVVKYLVETCQNDIFATDKEGRNALHYAAMLPDSDLDVVIYLLKTCHMDASAVDKKSQSVLHYAVMSFTTLTIEHFFEIYNLEREDQNGFYFSQFMVSSNITLVRVLVEIFHVDPSATDKKGRNALHHAAMSSRENINVVQYLVQTCKVDPLATDNDGFTAEKLAEQKAVEEKDFFRKNLLSKIEYLKSIRES